jgi:hypothetical protein
MRRLVTILSLVALGAIGFAYSYLDIASYNKHCGESVD